tara:strand:+ start:20 stop:619 length:600 start_codon:yes stop_codon:yes gene_type:complete
MGSKELRGRDIWQDISGEKAGIAEHNFFQVFSDHFANTNYKIRAKPGEFKEIYVNVELDDDVLASIYTPDKPIKKHGITPDYAIDNTSTHKTLYVEVKRQDGWVEGKPRSAGRGNAHERSCKFFTPGLQKILRREGNLGPDVLPFWTVFQGDIARDPCRVREITCWYGENSAHFFMWRDSTCSNPPVDHFEEQLRHLLD